MLFSQRIESLFLVIELVVHNLTDICKMKEGNEILLGKFIKLISRRKIFYIVEGEKTCRKKKKKLYKVKKLK